MIVLNHSHFVADPTPAAAGLEHQPDNLVDYRAGHSAAPGLSTPANRRRFTSKRDAIWQMSDY